MKKTWLLTFLFLGFAFTGYAQLYRTALGVRLDGEQFGVSLQQKILERSTIEGIMSVGANELRGTALYEWHRPILGKRFNYYLGAGGHVGNLKDNGIFTGVDIIGGVEYKINGLPLLISADIKPALHFNHTDWTDFSTGVSIRYVILPEKKKKRSLWPFGQKEETSKKDRRKKAQQDEEEGNDLLKIFRRRDN